LTFHRRWVCPAPATCFRLSPDPHAENPGIEDLLDITSHDYRKGSNAKRDGDPSLGRTIDRPAENACKID
jgi:hypothetical protein